MSLFRIPPGQRDLLVNTYLDLIPLVMFNVIWFLLLLPVVTALPATAGLWYATNRLAHHQPADWRALFEGMRRYFWQSWAWGILNGIALVVIFSNNVFYALGSSGWAGAARVVVIVVALLWFTVQVYAFPLLFEQEQPHFRQALRNSLVLILKRPLASLGNSVLIGVIILFCTLFIWPTWIVITAALCLYLANRATIQAIAAVRAPKTGGTV